MTQKPPGYEHLEAIKREREKDLQMDMSKLIPVSWKTTITGLGTILFALGQIGGMLKTGAYDYNVLSLAIGQIIVGGGLMFAKDANVTGEPPHKTDAT